jgi:hypothetical protein
MNETVAAFRNAYRAEKVPRGYRGYVHLAGTVGFASAGIAACVSWLDPLQPNEWLTVPASFLYANLVEYAGHRGPMHHRLRALGGIFERHARDHHRFFTDEEMQLDSSTDVRAVLFPLRMVFFYFGVFGVPVALLLGWLASRNVALLFLATGFAYYLSYELLHLAYHSRPDGWLARIPGIRVLRRLHTRHHDPLFMQLCNFNITWPIGDILFRTLFAVRPGDDQTR